MRKPAFLCSCRPVNNAKSLCKVSHWKFPMKVWRYWPGIFFRRQHASGTQCETCWGSTMTANTPVCTVSLPLLNPGATQETTAEHRSHNSSRKKKPRVTQLRLNKNPFQTRLLDSLEKQLSMRCLGLNCDMKSPTENDSQVARKMLLKCFWPECLVLPVCWETLTKFGGDFFFLLKHHLNIADNGGKHPECKTKIVSKVFWGGGVLHRTRLSELYHRVRNI